MTYKPTRDDPRGGVVKVPDVVVGVLIWIVYPTAVVVWAIGLIWHLAR